MRRDQDIILNPNEPKIPIPLYPFDYRPGCDMLMKPVGGNWLIYVRVSTNNGYMDGRLQIKVLVDERTQVHSAQSTH